MNKKERKSLVPPLDMCLMIPKKKFRDTYFAWVPRFRGNGSFRKIVYYELLLRPSIDSQCVPAPTLEEIMDALVCRTNEPCVQWNGGWYVSGDRLNGDGRPETHDSVSSVTAAMKLYLELEEDKKC